MNFLKTTTLLTVMTLIVVFTAQALGFSLISSLFFAFLFILRCGGELPSPESKSSSSYPPEPSWG